MSKKYVIYLPDDAQYILINGASENHCYTRMEQADDLEELNSDYINENFGELQDEAYQRGVEDGAKSVENWNNEEKKLRLDEAYQRGLEDAWEAARKIALMDTETSENVTGYFGLFRIMENLTPMQAIAKLKAYEDKQKNDDKFEFGDEIIDSNGEKGCVVSKGNEEGDTIFALFSGYRTPQCIRRRNYRKTGKHYDIQSILEAMKS